MTTTLEPPAADAAAPTGSRAAALAVAGLILFLLVAYLPDIDLWQYLNRLAIVLPFAGWGIVELARLVARGDRPAAWVAGLMAWGLFASLVSPEPRLAIAGDLANDRQWLIQASVLTLWAVGRRMRPGDRPLLTGALLVGLGANALFAILQITSQGYGLLQLSEGRALGFQASPVYLGGIMTGGMVLCAVLATSSSRWWWSALAGVAIAALAADLSGSRSALLLGIPIALLGARRGGWRRLGLIVVSIVIGLALSAAIAVDAGTTSSADRLGGSSGGGGVHARTTMWEAGVEAAAERPLTGWGVGRFRTATSPRITADFARSEGPDKEYFDAHNLFVEQLVTTGIPGLVLLVGFGWSLRRRVAGPLAWFAAGIAATWLLEPMSIMTGPLVLLALGAAHIPARSSTPVGADEAPAAAGDDADPTAEPGADLAAAPSVADSAPAAVRHPALRAGATALVGVLVLAGAVQGVRIVLTGRDLLTAQVDASPEAIERVRSRFPNDAALADTAAIIYTANTDGDPDSPYAAQALAAAREATRLEPSRGIWWSRRARSETNYAEGSQEERFDQALEALQRGYARSPWSVQVLFGLYANALDRKDEAAAERWEAKLCEIDACPVTVEEPAEEPVEGD